MSKKFFSVALTAVTAVSMSGMFALPANAQSTADLQAQIAALLAQIQTLQAQLSQAPAGGAPTSYNFTRDLTVGSKGADVTALQQMLGVSPATGYFGPLTKAALVKWQGANGVKATGYFGPLTRAKIATLGVGAGTGTGTGTGAIPAPVSGLAVSASSRMPAAGAIVAGASRQRVLSVSFTAGSAAAVNINQITLNKVGVVSDSNLSNAYVSESGNVLAQYSSLNSGVLSYSGLNLSVPAGQTRTLDFEVDISTSASAGNTIAFNLGTVTGVDGNGNAVTKTGGVNGPNLTVTTVASPSLATLTIASSSIGTTVTAGSQNVAVGAWSFTGANSKLNLKGIKFTVIGSANKSDLKNVKLYVNGTQTGQTLASVGSDGSAYFDLSSSPAVINTGANNVQVFADVMGSPSFNFQFELLNAWDVYAVDSQYNVPVSGSANVGTQISINQGSITVTTDSATPTGNIAKGQTGATLAKYDIYAAGEPVKVKWLTFTLAFTGFSGADLDTAIKNVSLTDDAGGQVGTSISSLVTSKTCEGTFSAATTTATNCFGNSSAPISYIVPANTTRVLSLKGDIQSGASFTNVTAALVAGSSNLQGMTSSQANSSGAASGSAISLAASALTVAKNGAIGTQTFAAGGRGVLIGSYTLSPSSAQGVSLSNVTITMASGTYFQNLNVKINGVAFGNTQGVLSNTGAYTFSGNPVSLAAGTPSTVNVYADILSSTAAQTLTTPTTLSGCSASGAVSLSAISCTSTAGQNVIVAGQATIQVAIDNSTAGANQVVMGTTQAPVATFLVTETTNIEDVKITDLTVWDQVATTGTVKAAFSNLTLTYGSGANAGTVAGTSGAAVTGVSSTPFSGYSYTFHFGTPIVVPKSNSVSLVLKGDVASYSSSGATDNSTHTFRIATTTETGLDTTAEVVVAVGNTSNASSVVSLSAPTGNIQTVLRTTLAVSGAANGATTNRTRTATDDVAKITFTPNTAGGVILNTVVITLSGGATSNATNTVHTSATQAALVASLSLIDDSTGTTFCSASLSSSTLVATFALTNCNLTAAKTVRVRLDSTQTYQSTTAGAQESLAISMTGTTGVGYTDALSGGTSGINLPANVVPLTIATVSYSD